MAVSEMLGHASIQTTSVYTHVADAEAENPAAYLEQGLGEGETENELAALRQRAERAAQKGGVVAVDGRMLLVVCAIAPRQGTMPVVVFSAL